MANIPATSNPGPAFQPAFKRVVQSHDFDCGLFACIAMVANKTEAEVRKVAVEKFEVPEHGPWWMTDVMLTGICNSFGWGVTAYKEVSKIADLPDTAFLMVDFNAQTQIGRHVIFHRVRAAAGVEYIIDPAEWITDPTKQIRMDVKSLPPPLWYVGVEAIKGGYKTR